MKNNSIIIWDPIYKNINFSKEITNIIDTNAFQRLRRILQTGAVVNVFPGASHTRFSHSCGVYHLSNILVKKNEVFSKLPEYDKKVLSISCLLHDIGHGPLSHFFERITKINHEYYTKKIIMEDNELNEALKSINKNLPKDLCNALDKKYKNKIVNSLLSSNVDLDRMDYLIRDSYFCGINIGKIDYQWIIENIKYKDQKIYFNQKCESTVEMFLMSRYYMYKEVYFHKRVISFDGMMILFFNRLKYLYSKKINIDFNFSNYEQYNQIIKGNKLSTKQFLQTDDYNFLSFVFAFKNNKDAILSFLSRSLYSNIVFRQEQIKNDLDVTKIKDKYLLYFYQDKSLNPFKTSIFKENPIYIEKDGKLIKLENNSLLIKNLINGFKTDFKKKKYIYFSKDFKG